MPCSDVCPQGGICMFRARTFCSVLFAYDELVLGMSNACSILPGDATSTPGGDACGRMQPIHRSAGKFRTLPCSVATTKTRKVRLIDPGWEDSFSTANKQSQSFGKNNTKNNAVAVKKTSHTEKRRVYRETPVQTVTKGTA